MCVRVSDGTGSVCVSAILCFLFLIRARVGVDIASYREAVYFTITLA